MRDDNKSSNYDKLSEEWRLKFLEMDKELVKKTSGNQTGK